MREKDSMIESTRREMLSSQQTLTLPSRQQTERSELEIRNHGLGSADNDTMSEIKDLKKEIARLTESLSGFATFTQSHMQSQRSLDSKNQLTEVRNLAGVGATLESRESTNAFEKMDLDELHSIQEDLKRKMQTTNQLIESRSRSNSVRSLGASSAKNDQDGKSGFISAQKLHQKHIKTKKD